MKNMTTKIWKYKIIITNAAIMWNVKIMGDHVKALKTINRGIGKTPCFLYRHYKVHRGSKSPRDSKPQFNVGSNKLK